MGLDITAMRRISRKGPIADTYDWEGGERNIYLNGYLPERMDGMEPGLYSTEECCDFRAGSYGGYNVWREGLARLILGKTPEEVWDNPTPGPFVELIHFSDCEGVIGPRTSAKLAADFDTWEAKAAATGDEYWIEKYKEWQKAFHLAADAGCVVFH